MTRDTHPSEDALLRRIAAGDSEAFTALYRLRQPAIYRFALRMSGNRTVAEDVAQEVFMALIRGAGRFDPSRGNLTGFLFGIARNHLRKRWEQDRRLAPAVDDSPEHQPLHVHDVYLANETAARVRHAISTLPTGYREVVVLCELEEMSYEEAAAALNCPVGTVRSRLHRARNILIEKLRGANSLARGAAVNG